jgi:anti-sigma-K factor RskA
MKIEFDVISRFVHGQMPDDERTSFDQALANDAALRTTVASEIALYRDLQNAVRHHTLITPQKKEFESLLQEIAQETAPQTAQEIAPQTPALTKQNTGWWKFAAAAALIVSVAVYMFYPKNPPNTEALYAQYFAPDCDDATMGVVTQDDITAAKALVCAKKWAEAKIALNKITSAQTQLLLAHVLTETGEYDAALAAIDKAQKSTGLGAEWAQAGVFLKQNKIAECKQILLKIVETKAAHYKDAEALLKTL